MSAVFIDSATGELKYQGTSGTPAILSDGSGAVPFSTMVLHFPLVSSTTEIDTAAYSAIGNVVFDPSVLFSGNDKITRTIQLRVIMYTSADVTGQLRLYNLTTGSEVSGTVQSTNVVAPTAYSVTLTPGDNIPNSSNMYEVQLQITTPAEPSPGDYIVCTSAAIVVSYS